MSEQKITISDLPELTGTVEDGYMLPIDDGEITKKVSVGHFEEAASATARQYAEAAADSATAAAGSAHDAEQIATEIAGDIAAATQAATDARGSATRAAGSADAAAASDVQAQRSASSASTSANSASLSATDASGYKDDAQAAANRAASWADYPGQTGSGSAVNNAHFWADQARATVTGVASWNGRAGFVMPEDEDYDISMMGDVAISSPAEGQILKYKNGKWKNVNQDIEIDVNDPVDGQALVYDEDSDTWQNKNKMNIDGSDAADHVIFDGVFTVGERIPTRIPGIGTNSVAFGDQVCADANFSFAQGTYSFLESMDSLREDADAGDSILRLVNAYLYEDNRGQKVYVDNPVYTWGRFEEDQDTHETVIVLSEPLQNDLEADTDIYIKTLDPTHAYGEASFASGKGALARGNYSHAEGLSTQARGTASHAEGGWSSAESDYSHAEGYSKAYGDYSHAEGDSSQAHGEASHAEGKSTRAYGAYSHAEGEGSNASHPSSHAEGYYTKTGADYQHVQGKYNVGRSNTLFEIGNGYSNYQRKNVFEVDNEGNVAIHGANPGAYTFHITSKVASTAVQWCNKISQFSAPAQASVGNEFKFAITTRIGERIQSLAFDANIAITSISLWDVTTPKVSALTSANFTYTSAIYGNEMRLDFTISAAYISTTAIADSLNAVKNSASPGFACVYTANTLAMTGTIKGQGIAEQIPGLYYGNPAKMNALPEYTRFMQHVGDFYLPTGGNRWAVELEVDPGSLFMVLAYMENSTTGAYYEYSLNAICVPSVTLTKTALKPVASAAALFYVTNTWRPFGTHLDGVVDSNGNVTTKPRIVFLNYHSNNVPTAGLGMHLRVFRVY